MGGFLGGLGRLVAGVGPEATEMRENMLNRWQRQKELYTNTLSQLIASESNPDTRSAYIQNLFDLNKLKPGQDPSKVIKSMQESIAIHPVAQQLLTPPQSQPKPVAPGPVVGATPGTAGTQAGPIVGGEAAGLPALAGLIAGLQPNADNGGGSSGGGGAPPAATPPTSPVAPSDQGSVAKPVGLPAGAGIAPVAAAEATAPSAGIPPVSPTATPSDMPALQDPLDIYNRFMNTPHTPFAQPFLQSIAQQEVAHNEALRQTYEQRKIDLADRQAAFKELEPGLAGAPAWYQSAVKAWSKTPGMQFPQMLGAYLTPHVISPGTPGSTAPQGATEFLSGKPIDPKQLYRREIIAGQDAWLPIKNQIVEKPNELGEIHRYNVQTGEDLGVMKGAVAPSQIAPIKEPTAGGGVELTSPAAVRAGIQPVTIPGAVAPAMLPTQSQRLVTTTDAQGNQVQALQPVVSGKFLPGGSITPVSGSALSGSGGGSKTGTGAPVERTPEGQKIVGVHGLTPLQRMTQNIQLGTLNQTISRFQGILDHADLLSSLITAKKIQMQMDPQQGVWKAAINRAVPMTPAEAKLAADWISAKEDINTLRGPLSATGFRGPEAFAALTSQAGGPLPNVQVTKQVLGNTLQMLKLIRDAKAQGVSGGRGTVPPSSSIPPVGAQPRTAEDYLKTLAPAH